MKTQLQDLLICILIPIFMVYEVWYKKGLIPLYEYFKQDNIEINSKDQGFMWLIQNIEYKDLCSIKWFRLKLLWKFLYYAYKDIKLQIKNGTL